MKTVFFYFCFLILTCRSFAQFSSQWVHRLGNTSGDIGYSIATDAGGNVFVAGYCNGTVDFDPSAASYPLTASSNNDAFIAKYNSGGNLLWAHLFGSTSTDIATQLATDASGNVYMAMDFCGTVDADPGPGTASFTCSSFGDGLLIKLDGNGNYQWAIHFTSAGGAGVSGIATDAGGQVYVTGSFHSTVDFDPGAGIANLSSNGNSDVFFAKYNSSGNYVWARGMGATGFDQGTDITVDATGAVIITGYYRLTVDFDPGAGVNQLTAGGGNDVFFAKYDASGNYVWARSIGAADLDVPGGVLADASNQVLVTGAFSGTVDFDPGAASFNLVSAGSRDIFFAKYDASGNFLWARSVGSASGSDQASDLVGDGTGGFYLTGDFVNTVDFDPGGAVVNLASNGSSDVFFAHYDANGNYLNASNAGGTGSDVGLDLSLADANTVLITGYFTNTADFDPGSGVNNLISAGVFDVFFGKYSGTATPLPVQLAGFTVRCDGNDVVLQWQTVTETAAGYFEIEASTNGVDWFVDGREHARGNSGTPTRYMHRVGGGAKNHLYRLKVVDADGSFVYSEIRRLACAAALHVQLHPNPVRDRATLLITGLEKGEMVVEVLNQLGQRVWRRMVKPEGSSYRASISLAGLPSGLYLLRVFYQDQHSSLSFIK